MSERTRSVQRTVMLLGGRASRATARASRFSATVLMLFAIATMTSCRDSNAVSVKLTSTPLGVKDPFRLALSAQVTGPTDSLQYKWFAVSGLFDPQETGTPSTDFRFDPRATKDRVSVEVWRGNTRVARAELDVQLDATVARLVSGPMPRVDIAITQVPSYSQTGGSETREDIRGRVSGELSPGDRVVLYARADAWYIQPAPLTLHAIGADSSWSSWTHTGSSYAALVVREGYVPLQRLDVLPPVEGDVLAKVIVEGKRR